MLYKKLISYILNKRHPNISGILHHSRDNNALQYMSRPPMVAYTHTKSLRDILVRSKVPPSSYRMERRQARVGFTKCLSRVDCSICSPSVNRTSHTCNFTGEEFKISSNISCPTPQVIYTVSCNKQSGDCARVKDHSMWDAHQEQQK